MPEVIYDGPFPEVSVPNGIRPDVVARKGEPVEVPKDLADSLCEQEVWSRAPSKKKATRSAEAAKEDK